MPYMRAARALALIVALSPATTLLAPDAAAADLGGGRRGKIADYTPEPLPTPFTWAGLYVGVHAGYGWSSIDWQEGIFSGSQDGDGWLAGGQIGFNLQSGRLVYGLEADATGSWIEGGNADSGHATQLLYSVRARLGMSTSDNRWLFYVTGGAAWADMEYANIASSGYSDTHFGWVAGAGIERALTPNVTARLEYLHYDFDSLTSPAGSLGAGSSQLDPSVDTVRLGINYKF
jgi:outer membrane immunogenic protein